jgi:SAM-dependent methyltransferase
MQSHHLKLAKKYWTDHLYPGDVVIDATCGNGHDTLFLSQLSCQVFSLDIQTQALENAKRLGSNASFLLLSHAFIDEVVIPKAPRLIVYNLGYLPGGDKTITTQCETTLSSIEKSLQILADNGAVSITCYPGHGEGLREEQKIVEYLSTLPSYNWKVCHHKYINRPKSPTFFWVEPIT